MSAGKMKGQTGYSGFTFIEVMVSVAIFAVISTISFATVSQYLKVRDGVEASNRELRDLQRVFLLLERDVRFMVNRPVRDDYGDSEPAYTLEADTQSGEIFRITVSQPELSIPGNTRLNRVSWRLQDGDLYRDSWLVLDRVQDSEPVSRLILQQVDSLQLLSYLWDDIQGAQQSFSPQQGVLPYAIEITVRLDDDREYRRLFDLANGS